MNIHCILDYFLSDMHISSEYSYLLDQFRIKMICLGDILILRVILRLICVNDYAQIENNISNKYILNYYKYT